MTDLFFYGTLRYLPLLEQVLGRALSDISLSEATMRDHCVYAVRDEAFPMIVAEEGGAAQGLLVRGLLPDDIDRLIFYEGGFDYDLSPRKVELPDGSTAEARVFFPEPGLWIPDHLWSLDDWATRWGEMTLIAAQEVMAQFGKMDAAEIARCFPAIRTRAWARMAARRRSSGMTRSVANDVFVLQRTHPYLNYFGVDEIQVQHRQNDGSMSPVLSRSGLMQGSAVVVLPYDPVRDAVLLVEQFRAPVFLNDDPDPWMWEPIAGMIDPGETPEQTAHREAMEEARVTLNALEYVSGAYSSSGSSTEYIHLYVGLGDLTTTITDGGVSTEGEDIRTRVLPFHEFLNAVDANAFKDLPLLALAHWLARHRDRLRG